MKVAKRFRWEGAHRLPWHTDGCQNLHGHSYQLWVELSGPTGENGMLLDFKDIKKVLAPLVKAWDHAVLVAETDTELLKAMELLKSKHYTLPYDTTSENICRYVISYLAENALDLLLQQQVNSIHVKLQETESCYATHEVSIAELQAEINEKRVAEAFTL
ncbi:6-pyruvoyltetrahydropterin/6-carboxytetrahydropterin synthase [Pontibacter aydingkolensis]|uniref:6-carboxy-5,6,7,8-tetrahydropterin synthase n=1 Tax=Pontibacter aydingkolensis TaxID=1911536 RepID=A0ABS7CS69_9BACT|nr:6-carboxytetrahydropterin synthase [Pontibacter aydingkolensis]MBW7466347.1 6-carboxytetrahydropterin synthase [Pontibacter aydingkolensis]